MADSPGQIASDPVLCKDPEHIATGAAAAASEADARDPDCADNLQNPSHPFMKMGQFDADTDFLVFPAGFFADTLKV